MIGQDDPENADLLCAGHSKPINAAALEQARLIAFSAVVIVVAWIVLPHFMALDRKANSTIVGKKAARTAAFFHKRSQAFLV
jgi:hypothetical protein